MSEEGSIELRGLRVLGTHGVLPEERLRPQPFEMDLVLAVDLGAAARSDDLADTVDYAAVAEAAAGVVAGASHQLLESLGAAVAREVLAVPGAEAVRSVTVSLRKLRPPLPLDLASAGVRLTRTR